MSHAYYTTPISDNIEETPEGNLICRDAVIARTGWQQYQVRDLPQQAARQLGVDVSNPQANIDLYRSEDDVFSPDTLASFEGKAVTDGHPSDFVTPSNFNEVAKGHIQNVRRGDEPLESGEWPIIADIHITAEPLLSKVRNKMVRELSCGYDYSIARDGERINQIDMIGNHVAVVPKGRAGEEARINDAAPAEAEAAQPQLATSTKEVPKVSNIFKHLLGLGLKSYASTEADPEKLAEAAEAVRSAAPKARAADAEPEVTVPTDDRRHADDRRKRMHDALDRMLDAGACEPGMEPEGSEGAMDRNHHADDTDMNELRSLLGDYFSEEEEEPQHVDDEESELPPPEEEETEPSGTEEVVGEDRAAAADARGGAMMALRAIRPFVARTKDQAMRRAFNTALATISKGSKATTGSYGSAANGARARDKKVEATRHRATANDAVDPIAKLQEAYRTAHKGGK